MVAPVSRATSCAAVAIIWARLPIPSLNVLRFTRISGDVICVLLLVYEVFAPGDIQPFASGNVRVLFFKTPGIVT